jgi:hypothetical protein
MSGDARLLNAMLFFKKAAVDLLASWATTTTDHTDLPTPIGGRNSSSDAVRVSTSTGSDETTDVG